MLEKLLPKQLDNTYTGNPMAKYMLIIIAATSVVRSLIHMLYFDGGAQSIAGIPLNTYPHNASSAIVLLFGLWGESQMLFSLIYLIVLFRYQRLIPLMFLEIIIEYAGRIIIMTEKPTYVVGTAPGSIGDYIILPVAILMFILSLTNAKKYLM